MFSRRALKIGFVGGAPATIAQRSSANGDRQIHIATQIESDRLIQAPGGVGR
jgi:hypothetical protein